MGTDFAGMSREELEQFGRDAERQILRLSIEVETLRGQLGLVEAGELGGLLMALDAHRAQRGAAR